ncbi:velvet factor [Cunninghamella echinulata]|nr:velvet factor [Cunninghamella echinulata]
MTASSSSRLNYQVHSKYTLKICQQPLRARLCSFKDKVDRRPLDPPPIIQLVSNTIDESKYSHYFLYATLVSEDGNDNIAFLENNRTTAGDVVQSLYRLRDFGNNDGVFFIFSDISIRMEGFFRLRFTLFEIIGSYSQCKCSVLSDVFQVYSPKSFPGMSGNIYINI